MGEIMKKMMLVLGLLIGLSAVFMMGCSRSNPVAPGNAQNNSLETVSPNTITPYQYPEAANYPPPGYQFIALVNPEEVTLSDYWNFSYINKNNGGTVWLSASNIRIYPNGLPYNSWIGIGKESWTSPWLEFEPHGLVFNFPQRVRMSYAGCTLPPNVEPEDLTIWYWNEELNVYEYIGGDNDEDHQRITFYLNHFSRYVVAAPE
jgi:hypothetical protein